MADKFTEFAGRMGKAPKGVGTGLKLLVAAAAAAYGIRESVYTGIIPSSELRLGYRRSMWCSMPYIKLTNWKSLYQGF